MSYVCVWKPVDGGVKCKQCGVVRPTPRARRCPNGSIEDKPPSAVPVSDPDAERDILLGDRVQAFFESHGITPEAYVEFKKKHGLDKVLGDGCNCDQRKELLNIANAAVRNGAAKLKEFLGWKK